MSYTEIFKFNKTGNAEPVNEVKNSWRGAMAVWNIMDERYLPSFVPEWAKISSMPLSEKYYRTSDQEKIKEIWALADDPKVSEIDKIVLGSTFDNVIVLKENLPLLVKAFREFEGNTSLKEQADIIEEALKEDSELLAISWNQTSVNEDCWRNFGGRTEEDEDIPYNILTMIDRHWELFEDLKKNENEKSD